MYDIANKNNGTFGISGYQVPKEYHDARQLKYIREGQKPMKAPRATKQGDYISQAIKLAGQTPAPNQYEIVKPWAPEKKDQRTVKPTQKRTFLEEIGLEAKRRPIPGPGAYDVLKGDQKKASSVKPRVSERDNFLMDYEYSSDLIPGPGNYNPRPIQPKIKDAKLKPEDWRKKHKEEGAKKKGAGPDMGSYTPAPANYATFDKIMAKQKDNKGGKQSKLWGSEVRFDFEKKPEKKRETVPGPGQYNMIASWGPSSPKGANDKKGNTNIFNKITTGISKSIYYS